MSIECVLLDLGIDFIDYASNLIKNCGFKKKIFITSHKRPIVFIKKKLGALKSLDCDFFNIEEFVQFVTLEFSKSLQIVQTKLERDLFFLDLISKNQDLYEKLGNSQEKVFVWAKRISSLFNEIDKQNLEEKLANFQYLEASEEARAILENLKSLYKIYKNAYINYTYSGKMLSMAASLSATDSFKNYFKDYLFIFSGIIYLTESDKILLRNISSNNTLIYLVQTDLYERDKYRYNGLEYSFDSFSAVKRLLCDLSNMRGYRQSVVKGDAFKPTEFEFYEFSDTHRQTEFISNQLSYSAIPTKRFSDTSVVLPDSKSVYPLIGYLSKTKIPLNVTMGYPLKNSEFGLFVDVLFSILIDMQRKINAMQRFIVDSKLLIKLLNISNVIALLDESTQAHELFKKAVENGSIIYEFTENVLFFEKLINPFLEIKDTVDLYNAFENMYNLFSRELLLKEEFNLIRYCVEAFLESIYVLKAIIPKKNINLIFAFELIRELIKDIEVAFEGVPLKGVQIMGMLESRLLSFKELYVADVNESILPSGDSIDPLINEDLKNLLGLTSFKEREDLIKYNFFRLVYSADKVYILYKSAINEKEKALRSPFVDQLYLMEKLKNRQTKISSFSGKIVIINRKAEFIKREEIVNDYFKKQYLECRFSPSALDRYLNCPYSYYLHYIKDIDAPLMLEREFQADKFGRLLHKIFELNFKPFLSREIDKDDYKDIEKNIIDAIVKLPDIDYLGTDIKNFLNQLSEFNLKAIKLILKYRIGKFFNSGFSDFQSFILLGLEKRLEHKELGLYGYIDRIDRISDRIRIIDYKTGYTIKLPKKRHLEELESICSSGVFSDNELKKISYIMGSVQLPAYLILAEKNIQASAFEAQAYLIANSNDLVKPIKADLDDIKLYKKAIEYVIKHMINAEVIYPIKNETCRFCDYNIMCKYSN